jgi:hypothetical protein
VAAVTPAACTPAFTKMARKRGAMLSTCRPLSLTFPSDRLLDRPAQMLNRSHRSNPDTLRLDTSATELAP